jgi:fructokinase
VRIGLDLGGTKIECAAFDAAGREIFRRRAGTPRNDYDGTVALLAALVAECELATGRRGTVGIGTPGAISPATGLIKNSNSTWLNGRPLARDLEAALARPLRFANDADCFALSEATDGAGRGARVVFGVIVGTGAGGGLVVDGRVVTGPNATTGEWGHNPLPWPRPEEWPGPACYCGRTGCIETFLSGPGLARDYRQAPGAAAIDAVEIARRAEEGDALADAALRRYTERMARALASIINVVDPHVVVLGGGMSNIERLYDEVPGQWGAWVFSDRVDTLLRRAMHGDASGVRGAAWLWEEGETTRR